MGAVDANEASACNSARVIVLYVTCPEPTRERDPPLAAPIKVMLVPVNVISPVPEVFVAPVSKLALWPAARVKLPLRSAKAAVGNIRARATAASAAILLVNFVFKSEGTDFIK